MSDSFLSRWSRRKQAAAQPETARDALPDPAAPELEQPPTDPAAPAGEPTLSPEELAALPAVDTLEAETDITGFLRQGVPHVLRNAALRRAWALDPKIRDFLCEAREYAYDWNVPGGVPGSGPLLPTDDVQSMLARILGDGSPPDRQESEAPVADRREGAPEHEQDTVRHAEGADAAPEAESDKPERLEIAQVTAEAGELPAITLGDHQNSYSETVTPQAPPTRLRRHGGAKPV